jgi:hypothetical protein
MIEWLDEPLPATNIVSGFEVLIHGFAVSGGGVDVLYVTEEGLLMTAPVNAREIRMDYRFKRGEGWRMLGGVSEDQD